MIYKPKKDSLVLRSKTRPFKFFQASYSQVAIKCSWLFKIGRVVQNLLTLSLAFRSENVHVVNKKVARPVLFANHEALLQQFPQTFRVIDSVNFDSRIPVESRTRDKEILTGHSRLVSNTVVKCFSDIQGTKQKLSVP